MSHKATTIMSLLSNACISLFCFVCLFSFLSYAFTRIFNVYQKLDTTRYISVMMSIYPLTILLLKALGHVIVNKPIISITYIVVYTWSLCSAQILVDAVNPTESYFQKSTNISAIVQYMSVSFVSLQSSRVHI